TQLDEMRYSEIKNQDAKFCTNNDVNLVKKEYPAVFDENLIKDQTPKTVCRSTGIYSSGGISKSDYQSKTVKVIITQGPQKKPNSGQIHWSGLGQSIVVHGYTIKNPFTYWSDGSNSSQEASCIDRALPVEKIGRDPYALPYYPNYSTLTPDQRGNYLSWMSNGRDSDLNDIGYAFIFFYGLERRAIFENEDVDKITEEAHRILVRYPQSNSFNFYLNRFVTFNVALKIHEMDDSKIKNFYPMLDELDDNSSITVLAWYVLKAKEIPWELMYSLARNSQKTIKSNIPKKHPLLLKKLYEKKFNLHFSGELPPIPATHQHYLAYSPVSLSLKYYSGFSRESKSIKPAVLDIPNIGTEPFKTAFSIWAECLEELKSVTNKLNKTDGKMTREVYGLLPRLLKEEYKHPDLESWQQFHSTKTPTKGSIIVQISDIAPLVGITKRESLTATQCNTMVTTAHDNGYILIPDQKISGSSYKWNDSVAIIPVNNAVQITDKFSHAALIFEMAYTIAASDENVSEIEENVLHNYISKQFSLNSFEIECLKGLQQTLKIQPPSLSKIGKRLSKYLNPEQKMSIASFLGDIVLLDNKFTKEEQKSLKTVFKALEIDPSISDEIINKLLIGHIPEEPTTVLKAGKSRKGEAIPPQAITPEFSINKEKLKQTLEDTRAVQNILASVFEQEEEEIVIDLEPEVKIPKLSVNAETRQNEFDLPFPQETIPSLDSKYLSMLHDIMKSNEVSQDDFTILAKKYNLMPRAAFDDINTWADEELGDFLLEESENRIVINYKR
ncbi:TerB N-terminal domain-containing protein, partial [Methanoregula sp.]|uniref:tellurite resistance TerB family protein n=1 Tax=Methanoregula sp. TaxID=2052170 RepID=UPI0025FE3F86